MSKNYDYYMRADLSKYTGEYVIVCDEQVVWHGKDPRGVIEPIVEKYPGQRPFFAFVMGSKTWFL